MKAIEDRKFKAESWQRLVEIVTNKGFDMVKYDALFEVGCRAIDDHGQLSEVWSAVGEEIQVVGRNGLPFGPPARTAPWNRSLSKIRKNKPSPALGFL